MCVRLVNALRSLVPVISLLMIGCASITGAGGKSGAAKVVRTKDDVVLDVPHYGQLGKYWCWAASLSMVSTGLHHSQSQCAIASNHFNYVECCHQGRAIGTYDFGVWPIPAKSQMSWREEKGTPLSWQDLSKEIDSGRPMGYVYKHHGGSNHMVVIKGYRNVGGIRQLWILDPMEQSPWVDPQDAEARLITEAEYRDSHRRTYWAMIPS